MLDLGFHGASLALGTNIPNIDAVLPALYRAVLLALHFLHFGTWSPTTVPSYSASSLTAS
jgi:hypothetical protein